MEKRLKPAVGRSSPEDKPSARVVAVAGRSDTVAWMKAFEEKHKTHEYWVPVKRHRGDWVHVPVISRFFTESVTYIPRSPVLNSDESLPELAKVKDFVKGRPLDRSSCYMSYMQFMRDASDDRMYFVDRTWKGRNNLCHVNPSTPNRAIPT